ncbi:MAG: amino acid adenylation domain-containing protein [Clostridia bacterium]|nr:amino acid adenylation domain-containing protein [Clostridia bacterium]
MDFKHLQNQIDGFVYKEPDKVASDLSTELLSMNNSSFKSQDICKQEEYWLGVFSGDIPVLNLTTDYPRSIKQTFEQDIIKIELNKELTKALMAFVVESRVPMYTVLLAVFNILFFKHTGQEDIVIGYPVTAKNCANPQGNRDVFDNILAMRNFPEGEKAFSEFLEEVKTHVYKAIDNKDYPFEKLVDRLNVKKNFNIDSLFNAALEFRSINSQSADSRDFSYISSVHKNNVYKFDLLLWALEAEEELSINLEFNQKLFMKQTVERMAGHFINIISQVVKKPDIKLREINAISEAERNKVLFGFNQTEVDYAKINPIHQMFEMQVQKTPENLAVTYNGLSLTYKDLNERANRLARVLRRKGIKPDSIVAIMSERSIELIVGILAILKAGGAYLPIDPEYPSDRINYMLEDSAASVLLTRRQLAGNLMFEGEVLYLEDGILQEEEVSNMEIINTPQDLAYVIYTSGSTGKPKGVMVEHRALENFIYSIYAAFSQDVGGGDRCLSLTNISFDVSVCEIFLPLVYGADLVMFDSNKYLDIKLLSDTITNNNITFAYIPPAILSDLNVFLKESGKSISLNKMLVGVEPIKDYVLEAYLELNNSMKIINGYGPTETTICSTFYVYKSNTPMGRNVPIGKPLQNTRIYILDESGSPTMIGATGEVFISGTGIARGYLNRPELTKEKFIGNPFISEGKMYRTGDLARWMADGNIEFVGRVDHQVKIRGYRVELGEIESELIKHPDIKEAVVIAKQDTHGVKYLCAYIVLAEELTSMELTEHLLKTLPHYMIPARYVKLHKMPLTANGKLDRKALPEPEYSADSNIEYIAPTNYVQGKLVEMWEQLIGLEGIGIEHNFLEIGGNSLKAAKLAARIHKELNVDIAVKEIFLYSTIKKLEEYIAQAQKSSYFAISPIEEKEYYPVSSAQKRLYLMDKMEDLGTSYNIPSALQIEGHLNKDTFANAFKRLIDRHEALRTSFEIVDGELLQRIHKHVEFEMDYIELEMLCKDNIEFGSRLDEIIEGFIRPFDLSIAPLIRVCLVKVAEDKHVLIRDVHHIVSDGVSEEILNTELGELYSGQVLSEMGIQYKDFSYWHNELLKSEEVLKQEEYWLEVFSGEIPVLNLPTDYPRPPKQSFDGDSIRFELSAEAIKKLKAIAIENEATLYMVLLAAYNTLLYRYTGQEDIIVGSPSAGRRHYDTHSMVGMFVNTLAMRNFPKGSKTFRAFLQEVKRNTLKTFDNQDYQFEELVVKLGLEREASRNPIFDTMFVLQNMNIGEVSIKGLNFTNYTIGNKTAQFDITLEVLEKGNKLELIIEYCTKLFKAETIQAFGRHFLNLLSHITDNPDTKLSEVVMLSQEEEQLLLSGFNLTKVDYPKDRTVQQIFDEQVKLNPDNIAVVFEDRSLTYRELNERATSAALLLKQRGVGAESIVGIMLERSIEMIVGIVGILKAGGAYLPIDPAYPADRIEYMLKDSGSTMLLTKPHLAEALNFQGEYIDVSDINKFEFKGSLDGDGCMPENLAYIIYTSGSTGQPKGVMIEHRGIVNLSYWFNRKYKLDENKNVLQMTSISFDVSVEEILVSLMNGATIYIPRQEVILDKSGFAEFIKKNNINIAQFVPMTLRELLADNEKLDSLKVVICGGEALDEQLKDRIIEKGYSLYNSYGPTETTVDAIMCRCKKGKVVLGKPISNTRVYILNDNTQLQPIGVPGELYIGGDGLARGYLNKPQLTEEKFVKNPFIPGENIYRTGDLARWLPDGSIEFLGRVDHQVKIRGHRIELGEIETQLLKHYAVKEAVVVETQDQQDDKFLCAYIVGDSKITPTELREHLLKILPDYMVPAHYIKMDKMPLSANGKVDRRALPKPQSSICSDMECTMPSNYIEFRLVNIWEHVMGVEGVNINHNFFDVGGHSLKAAKLASIIHKEFNVDITVKEVFKYNTIRKLEEYIEHAHKSSYSAILPVDEREYYPMSAAQKRLYLLNTIENLHTSYNMPEAFLLEGVINRELFSNAFKSLVDRHEALRTSFEVIDGDLVQRIHKDIEFKMDYMELEQIDGEDGEIAGRIDGLISSFIRPFDLSKAPLLRVCLVKLADGKHLLMRDMHHIISDGISEEILKAELGRLCRGQKLPELKVQYKDFSNWHNKLLKSEAVHKQEEYWLDVFSGEIPVLNLPTDYTRPVNQSFEGGSISCEINGELASKLKKTAVENGATLYMLLLAALNILLSRYSGQEDIVIGSPIAGRDHADIDGVVGLFVNTLAMRNKPEGKKTFKDFLKQVRDNTFRAYENQGYQFENLIQKLNIDRDMSRNPLFDVAFVLQNMHFEKLKIEGLNITSYKVEAKVSKFDIAISAFEDKDVVTLCFEYCTRIFKKETIQRLVGHYINILHSIVKNPGAKIYEIDMMSDNEKAQILFGFNDTCTEYDSDKTIHQLFEEQIQRIPDKTALVLGNKHVTYSELNTKANQIAQRLRTLGVKPGEIVGLMVPRSIEMLAGLMGILKAGGAYLPIDPEYPDERIRYMLDDSNCRIMVSCSPIVGSSALGAHAIDLLDEALYEDNAENLVCSSTPNDLAYVIYTSGSTGRPKGVMLRHRNVTNFIKGMRDKIDFNSDKTILCLTTISFDIFVLETLLPLATGMKIVIANEREQLDPDLLRDVITNNGVDMLQTTPSRLQMLLKSQKAERCLKSIQELIIGGEAFPETLFQKLSKLKNVKMYNVYGPTETTVWSTIKDLSGAETINIGKPIANTQIYITDKNNLLQPVGIPGELHIAGDGLAKGYLNRPELTAEKFIENPFAKGNLMYKTGDLARWLPNGEIEFIGRIDHQVKVRGYRIELHEIEKCMMSYEGMRNCVCIVKENDYGDKYLAVYYTASGELSISEIRSHLSKYLPDYMVPDTYMQLEQIPMTPNGKVDRKALPEPDKKRPKLGNEYAQAETQVEKEIVKIWEDLLKREHIGINDNFFELGGNSMLSVLMQNNIELIYPGKVNIADVFTNPTVAKLAGFISKQGEGLKNIDITPIKLPTEYFLYNDMFNADTVLEYRMDGDLYKLLYELSDEKGIELSDIMLSVYVYLLAEVSGQEKIWLQGILGDSKYGAQIYIDLSEVTDFTSLFAIVSRERKEKAELKPYMLEALSQMKSDKETQDVVAVFTDINKINLSMFKACDIILKINQGSNYVDMVLEYSATRIRAGKAEELFQWYIKLVKLILNKINN